MAENVKELLQDNLRVFVVPVEILEVEGLSIYEKMAYIVIRSHCNARGTSAFPSYSTIAREASMSRSSAIRAVEGLLQKGLLHKEIRYDVSKNRKVKHTSNNYTLENPSKVVSHRHQCPTDTTLVSHRHHPSVPQTPEHNHLTYSMNMIDCSGEVAAVESHPNDQDPILHTLYQNASICMIEDEKSLKDARSYIVEIYVMLHNQFPNQLLSEIVERACQLFSERAYDWKQPFHMKINMQNPVGFFHTCYKDAIKEYKALRSKHKVHR